MISKELAMSNKLQHSEIGDIEVQLYGTMSTFAPCHKVDQPPNVIQSRVLTLCRICQCNLFDRKGKYQLDEYLFDLVDVYKLFDRVYSPEISEI
jgi:hypothetical protein